LTFDHLSQSEDESIDEVEFAVGDNTLYEENAVYELKAFADYDAVVRCCKARWSIKSGTELDFTWSDEVPTIILHELKKFVTFQIHHTFFVHFVLSD